VSFFRNDYEIANNTVIGIKEIIQTSTSETHSTEIPARYA